MSIADEMNAAADSYTPPQDVQPEKGFLERAFDDVKGTAYNWATGAVQGINELAKAQRQEDENMENGVSLEQGMQDVQYVNKAQKNVFNETIAPLAMPAALVAGGAAPVAGGILSGQIYDTVKQASEQAQQKNEANGLKFGDSGYEDPGIAAFKKVMRDLTYGPLADFIKQPNLKEQFSQKPVSTTGNLIMAGLPPALIGKGAYDNFWRIRKPEEIAKEATDSVNKDFDLYTSSVKPENTAQEGRQQAEQPAATSTGGDSADISGKEYSDLAQDVSGKTGLPADWIWAQWYHESGGFTSQLAKEDNNFGGLKTDDPRPGIDPPAPDGGYYRHFDSPEEYADYFARYIKLYKDDGVFDAKNIDEYAQALKNGGYYGDSVENYSNGMKNALGSEGSVTDGEGSRIPTEQDSGPSADEISTENRIQRQLDEDQVNADNAAQDLETKEPWQMTREEWNQKHEVFPPEDATADDYMSLAHEAANENNYRQAMILAGKAGDTHWEGVYRDMLDKEPDPHKVTVEAALQDSKPVPAKVIKEYPDLAEKYPDAVASGAKYDNVEYSRTSPVSDQAKVELLNKAHKAAMNDDYETAFNYAKQSGDRDWAEAYHGLYITKGGTELPVPKLGGKVKGQYTDENITKSQLMKRVADLFTPVRTGRIGQKGVQGFINYMNGIIRSRNYGDIDVVSHEVGHLVDAVLGLRKNADKFDPEFAKAINERFGKDAYEPEQIRGEGIAEFFKDYITNPEKAKKEFPGFYDFFEKELTKNPDMSARVKEYKDMVDVWNGQSSEARSRGALTFGNETDYRSPTEKIIDQGGKLYDQMIDEKFPLHRLTTAVQKEIGRKLSFEEDPYQLARSAQNSCMSRAVMMLNYKSPGIMKDTLNKSYHDKIKYPVTFEEIFKGLDARTLNKKYPNYLKLGNFKNWHQALSAFLMDQRAIELNDVKYAQPLEQARELVTALEEKVKEAHSAVEDAKNRTYNNRFERSRILGEARDAERKAISEKKAAENAAFRIKNRGYKTPVSLEDARALVDAAPQELKDAAKKVYQYNENLLNVLEDGGIVSKDTIRELSKYKNYVPMMRDFSNEEAFADSLSRGQGKGFGNINSPLRSLEDTGSTRPVIDPLETMVKNTYMVFNLVERNRVAQAFVKLSKEPRVGKFVERVSGTTSDPEKSIFTVMVDGKKEAYQTLPEFYGPITAYGEGLTASFDSIFKVAAHALRVGATSSPPFIIRNLMKDTVTAGLYTKTGFKPVLGSIEGMWKLATDKELKAEFEAAGVPMATRVGLDRISINKELTKMASGDDTWSKLSPINLAKIVYEAARNASEFVESGTRMGEFAKARAQGMSIDEAGLAAKDVTLDFSRSGSIGKRLNQKIPFFNATLQGGDRLIRQFGRDTALRTIAAGISYITIPSIACWLLNHDQEWYQQLTDNEKNGAWFLDTGHGILRIPKPFEPGIFFGSAIERALDLMEGKDPHAIKKWALYARDQFAPNFLPALVVPFVQWITNYNFFTEKPVVNQREQNLPDEKQYNAYTTEIAKKIGLATGLSPEKIDMAINGYFGSAGKFIAGVGDYIIPGHTAMPAKSITEQPGLSGLFKTPFANPQSVQDFYDNLEKIEKNYNAEGKKGNPPAIVHNMRAYSKQIADLNKDNRNILNSSELTPEQKRQKMDANNAKILQIAKKANTRYPLQ